MALYDIYDKCTTLWGYLPKGEPRTMANQAALAAQSLVTNWLNNGGTIWDMQTNPFSDHPCQSCADWLYENVAAVKDYIEGMNKQSFAGRPELYTEVMDYDDEDAWSEDSEAYGFEDGEIDLQSEKVDVEFYDMFLAALISKLNGDSGLSELNDIAATGSIDDCQGPVYDVAVAYQG